MDQATYEIPTVNIGRFSDTIAKLNRRAGKLGCPEIGYEVLDTAIVPLIGPDGGVVGHHEVKRVTVTGEAPVIPGWSFLAVVDFSTTLGNGFLIRSAPGVEIPPEYRDALVAGRCDHCHTIRRRKETFIVRNDSTGELKQVGRQCLSDYTGHRDPASVAAYFSMLHVLMSSLEEGEFGGSCGDGGELLRPIDVFLRVVAAFVRIEGFLTRAKANDMNPWTPPPTTADKAWTVLNPSPSERARSQAWFDKQAPFAAVDEGLAAKILEWVPSIWSGEEDGFSEGLSQYEFNLRAAVQSGFVGVRSAGLVASAYVGYRRHVAEMAGGDLRDSRHIGKPKDRLTLTLTCLSAFVTEGGSYGPSTVIKFTDGANAFTWFASGVKTDRFEPGRSYLVKATVKKHGEYKGQKETYLTRVTETAQPTLKLKKQKDFGLEA